MHTFHLRKHYYGLHNFKTDNNNVVTSKSNSFLVQWKLLPSTAIQQQNDSTMPFTDNATYADDRKV